VGVNAAIFDEFASFVSPGKVRVLREHGIEFPIGRREGPFVWDAEGRRRLIDCHCNGGTFNLGHRNPAIVAALREALERLDIGNHHFPSEPKARLARRLAELAPGNLHTAVFGSCGGESIDLAIKVARRATGRRRIVCARGAYHGHTGLAVAAGEEKFARPFLSDSPDFAKVPFGDLGALREALREDTAALLLETIPATLGMPLPPEGYLAGARALCAERGALFIADEVQTGLGRTGRFWAVEHWGVEPDILVTAKGLSGGIYPISAALLAPAVARVFEDDPWSHVATFGGADLGCEVALAVLEISSAPGFLENVRRTGARIAAGAEALAREVPAAGLEEVRAKGSFIGLKFASEMAGPVLMRLCLQVGLLCFFAANDTSVLQVLPPLVADDALADEIVARLGEALRMLSGASSPRWSGSQ
jgi:acetylornithine/succinyldiaminopimelate/putrescine aminotransferase